MADQFQTCCLVAASLIVANYDSTIATMGCFAAALEAQQVLAGKFEGPISENYSTSIRAIKTQPGDAQRSSAPLIEESSSKAASLCSFVGVCLLVQRGLACQRQSCRHYYSYLIVATAAVPAIAVYSMPAKATAYLHYRCKQPGLLGSQYHHLGPIDL